MTKQVIVTGTAPGAGDGEQAYDAFTKAKNNFDELYTKHGDGSNLYNPVIQRGSWNPTSGSFPGSGSAKIGHRWRTTGAGTVDGVTFIAGEHILAIADNASTTTFSGFWMKETPAASGSGTGDMLKSTYDPNARNGDAFNRANHTGVAPISGTDGLQAALDSKADSIHNHDATEITTGVINPARLGAGTASSSTYLRGDNTWAAVAGGGGGGDVTKVGTPSANLIAYWADSSSLSHETGFSYDPTTDTLTVPNIVVGGESFSSIPNPTADSVFGWDDATGVPAYFTLSGMSIVDGVLTSDISVANITTIDAATSNATLITPDGLGGSRFGCKEMSVALFDIDQSVAIGVYKKMIGIPSSMHGMDIVDVRGYTYQAGVTGSTNIQILRRRSSANVSVLSTQVTIEGASAGDGVINTANDDLTTGDMLLVEVTGVHTTPPLGLTVTITAQMP